MKRYFPFTIYHLPFYFSISKFLNQKIRWKIKNGKFKIQGFTLIELLVVISIIGILTTLVAANLNTARVRARDTQRKSDLSQYRNALEIFANANNGSYPQYASSQDASSSTFCTALGFSGTNCPKDPQSSSGGTYYYQSDGSASDGSPVASQYVLWATMEYGGGTANYWVVCSSGKSGQTTTGIPPTGGVCPI